MNNTLTEQQKFDEAVACVKHFAPKFRTSLKSESKFHRMVGKLLASLGNKGYMDAFWTTIGSWCARPSVCDDGAIEDEWRVVFHEGRHAADSAKLGFVPFTFIYLFPQVLALLALALPIIALLGGPICLLWGFLALVALLPIPALGRAYMEYRAYVVTMVTAYWTQKIEDEDEYIAGIVKYFTGPYYYYMMPFGGLVTKAFKKKLQELKTGTFELDPYLALVRTKCFQWKK